ncbi:MAG TPA: hypothetical protein VI756_06775 [Blastocatellia bacterium]
MILWLKMITGFNTDVSFGGCLYHVQTEDRGHDHPFLESLVYVGGTIIAKKRTPYPDKANGGEAEEAITSLLRHQHQVIIAAIKAGRIDELRKHSAERAGMEERETAPAAKAPVPSTPPPQNIETPPERIPTTAQRARPLPPALAADSGSVTAASDKVPVEPAAAAPPPQASRTTGITGKLGLNLDQVVSDYMKRSSEQGKLDVRVLAPTVFTAGKAVALKVRVSRSAEPEGDSIVTVKIIGTAFKPQVFMARADGQGVATFNFSLPAFSAGTAAIVIEAQSSRGRGELKQLIRRA